MKPNEYGHASQGEHDEERRFLLTYLSNKAKCTVVRKQKRSQMSGRVSGGVEREVGGLKRHVVQLDEK